MARCALGVITRKNIGQVKIIVKSRGDGNEKPVDYYDKILASGDLSSLVYFNDIPVGLIVAFKHINPHNPKECSLVIDAIDVLPLYKEKFGLENMLIEHVISFANKLKATNIISKAKGESSYQNILKSLEFKSVEKESVEDLVPSFKSELENLTLYMKSLEIS